MKAIRVKKNKNYTTINNEYIFNKNLSLKAKGLLTHLLALPEKWKLYVEEVESWHKDGRRAVYSAFKELSELGYIERKQIRNKGKIERWDYIVYEKPLCLNLHVQNEDVENEDVQKEQLSSTYNNKDLIKLNTKKDSLAYPEELNLEAWNFWKKYRKEEFRKSYKSIGEAAAIKKLLSISKDSNIQKAIILQSIENGWMGLFPLKEVKSTKVDEIKSEYLRGLELIKKQF